MYLRLIYNNKNKIMNGMTKKQVEIIENIIVLQKEFDKISLSNKETPYLLLFWDSSNNYSERPLTPDNFSCAGA